VCVRALNIAEYSILHSSSWADNPLGGWVWIWGSESGKPDSVEKGGMARGVSEHPPDTWLTVWRPSPVGAGIAACSILIVGVVRDRVCP